METTQENKWAKFKEALKHPPAERLKKIEYQSHFLGIIGTLVVCTILILKGYWYVIFAIIFSVGVSYSQGMKAYGDYKMIMKYKPQESYIDILNDISPGRRRLRIVKAILGKRIGWLSGVIASGIPIWIFFDSLSKWYISGLVAFITLVLFIFLQFFMLYWIANPIFQKRCKEVRDATKETTS